MKGKAMDEPQQANDDAPKYVVKDSATANALAQVNTFIRDAALMVGFATALIGYGRKGNLVEFITFVRSEDAAPALGVIVAVGVAGYRQFKKWRDRRRVVTIAKAAPDSVAVVTK